MGDWGWSGAGDRTLEYPENNAPVANQEVSPVGRARVRFNTLQGNLEVSISSGDYMPLVVAGSGALTQGKFFIDPINGDDNNSGETDEEAIASWAEYERRVGNGVVTVMPFQTVNIINDIAEPIRILATYTGGLVIQGQKAPILAGSVSGSVTWDTSTSPVTPGTITDASLSGTWSDSGPGGTSLIGKLVIMTSGANVGKTGWLLADLGGKTARISQLYNVFTFASGAPAIGDTFDVVDLTVLSGGVVLQTVGSAFINVDSCDVTAVHPFLSTGGTWLPSDSKFVQTGSINGVSSNTNNQSIACLFSNSLNIENCTNSVYFNCSFIDARLNVDCSLSLLDINAMQKAGGAFAASDAFTVKNGGKLNCVGDVGVMDQITGSPSAFKVGTMGELSSGGVVFTVGQTVGTGVRVDAYGVANWPSSGAGDADAVYDLDVSGPATEWDVGGVLTTSAALGVGGAITPGNNAGAVQR